MGLPSSILMRVENWHTLFKAFCQCWIARVVSGDQLCSVRSLPFGVVLAVGMRDGRDLGDRGVY